MGRCIKKYKLIDERKTAVTVNNLSSDELSIIFIFVAKSGAVDVASLMAVCRLFSDVCKHGDVLLALNFDGVEISEGNFRKYQNINGLISFAAEAGHLVAQCMFAKVIMLACSKLSRAPSRISHSETALVNLQRDQIFMTQLNSKSSCNSKGFYEYRFIKVFLLHCCPSEFMSMDYPLTCYKYYCQKDSTKSRGSLRKMWVVCKHLRGYKYCWEWRPSFGGAYGCKTPIRHEAYAHQFKTKQELRAEFEELRLQALHYLDEIFIVR